MRKEPGQGRTVGVPACILGFAILVGCGGGGGSGGANDAPTQPLPVPPAPPPQEMVPPPLDPTGQNLGAFFAITNDNRFVTFDPGAAALSTSLAITGTENAGRVIGLEVRTVDRAVLVITELGSVYELNPRSGTTRFLAGGNRISSPFSGQLGVEFLSAPEEVRIVSTSGQRLSVTGFGDLRDDLEPRGLAERQLPAAPPGMAEIAATQTGVPCGAPPTLYYLDTVHDVLLVERQQGDGIALDPVGPLGVDAGLAAGFEIFQREDTSDVAIATLRVNGVLGFYGVDLATGRATLQSPVPPGLRSTQTLIGLAKMPLAAPPPRIGRMAALTQSGKLVTFDERAPLAICTPPRSITGLQSGETILDIDVRAADGLLYALTDTARLYTLSTALESFGAATFKSSLQAIPGASFAGLTRPTASMDFDAALDRLVIFNEDVELSVEVESGWVTVSDRLLEPSRLGRRFVAISGSFAPSPDFTRRRVVSERLTAPDEFGPILGYDVRGSDAMQFLSRRIDKLSGSVLERSRRFASAVSRALIGGGEPVAAIAYLPNAEATVFALTTDNQLLSFKPNTPWLPDMVARITGLGADEKMLAIEVRLADDLLYGLSDQGRIYVIDSTNAAAKLRSTLTSAGGAGAPTLIGQEADIAFGPGSGLLRVSVTGGKNFRVNVDTGALTQDASYVRGSADSEARFTGVAYLPSQPNPVAGRLLLIDVANHRLAALLQPGLARNAVRTLSELPSAMVDVTSLDIPSQSEAFAITSTPKAPATLVHADLLFGGIRRTDPIPLAAASDRVTGFSASLIQQATPEERMLFAVINQKALISFTQESLPATSPALPVSGMLPDELLLCIDFSGNGVLFGLGSSGRLYSIDTASGNATLDRVLSGAPLQGTRFDMDFDQGSGTLTVASDMRRVLNIDLVGNATDAVLRYAPPEVTPTAYSDSVIDSDATDHYFIDTVSASLQVTQADGSPTAGNGEVDESLAAEIVTVGPINALGNFESFASTAAFDVAGGADALALAALRPVRFGQSVLYSIQLGQPGDLRGAGRGIGFIGASGTAPIRGLAIRIR